MLIFHTRKPIGLFIGAYDKYHNNIHPPSCLLVAIVLLVIHILTCDKRNDYNPTMFRNYLVIRNNLDL